MSLTEEERERQLPPDFQRALQANRAYDRAVLAALDSPLEGRAALRNRVVSCSVAEYDPRYLLEKPPEDGDLLLFFGNPGLGKTVACDRHRLAEANVFQQANFTVDASDGATRIAMAEWARSLEHHCRAGNLHQIAYTIGRWPSIGRMAQAALRRRTYPFLAERDDAEELCMEHARKVAEAYVVNNVTKGFWFGRRDNWHVRVFVFFHGTTKFLKRPRSCKPEFPVVGVGGSLRLDVGVLVSGIRARKRWLRVGRHARVVAAAAAALRSLGRRAERAR